MTSTEDLLGRTLRRHAEQASYSPTPLAEVAAAAGVVRRRRRRAAVVATIAAVMAVAVPVAVLADRQATGRAGPLAPPTGSPGPSPTQAAQAPHRRALRDLPVGPAPRIGYTEHYDHVAPDGTRTALAPRYGIRGVTQLADGRVLVEDTRNFEGYTGLSLEAEGGVVRGWSTQQAAVVAPGGSVAWASETTSEASVHPPPRIYLAQPGQAGPGYLSRGVPDEAQPVGIIDGEVVYNQRNLAIRGRRATLAWIGDVRSAPRRITGVERVVDVDEVGATVTDGTGVLDPLTGRRRDWAVAPAWALVRFSPDGRTLLAVPKRGTPQARRVVDARTGSVTAAFTLPAEVSPYASLTWEDDTHFLALAEEGSASCLVRVGLDGRVERVTRVLHRPAFDHDSVVRPAEQGYVIAARP